ncbi:hypothetical protein ZIOFF_053101 [Zingiber officinale]|uniref:NAD(P)H dehydrogenase subunit H n=1 Tax=Zingiber officinale TaxID=94328 RepID=A0A8J5KLQ0_ZINOF|nr:hypothetical protein ZIOFF_053101 [Zingiber officinale]
MGLGGALSFGLGMGLDDGKKRGAVARPFVLAFIVRKGGKECEGWSLRITNREVDSTDGDSIRMLPRMKEASLDDYADYSSLPTCPSLSSDRLCFSMMTKKRKIKNFTSNFGPQHPAAHGVSRLVLEMNGEMMERAEPHIGLLQCGMKPLMPSRLLCSESMDGTSGKRPSSEKAAGAKHESRGARMHASFIRPDGVAQDLPLGLCRDIDSFTQQFASRIDELEEMSIGNRIWKERLMDIGTVSAQQAKYWGFSGVMLRGRVTCKH